MIISVGPGGLLKVDGEHYVQNDHISWASPPRVIPENSVTLFGVFAAAAVSMCDDYALVQCLQTGPYVLHRCVICCNVQWTRSALAVDVADGH
jgi:hypothetical protein